MKHHYHINKSTHLQVRRGLNEGFFRIHINAKEHLTKRFLLGLNEFCYKIFVAHGVAVKRSTGFMHGFKVFNKSFYRKFAPFALFFKHLIRGSSLSLLLNLKYFKRGLHIWLG